MWTINYLNTVHSSGPGACKSAREAKIKVPVRENQILVYKLTSCPNCVLTIAEEDFLHRLVGIWGGVF